MVSLLTGMVYDEYLTPYLETYAYCLLPNHFHLLVRVKEAAEIRIPSLQGMVSVESTNVGKMVSEQFRRFFISYSQSINKQEARVGSLFQKNFKRKEVKTDSYFTAAVYYIHANPQNHGICADFREYPHSSYQRILLDKPSKLKKSEVLDWFGGSKGYLAFHGPNKPNKDLEKDFFIED